MAKGGFRQPSDSGRMRVPRPVLFGCMLSVLLAAPAGLAHNGNGEPVAEIRLVGDANPSPSDPSGFECWKGPVGAEIAPPGMTPITNLAGCYFDPPQSTINVGETIRFIGDSYYTAHKGHCFGIDNPGFCDTGPIGRGFSSDWTFTIAGTYRLQCAFHPETTASLTVLA